MSQQKVSQAQNGRSMFPEKKFVILESRLIEGRNIIYNVLEQMGKLLRFCLNFPRLLGVLKITCDLCQATAAAVESQPRFGVRLKV